MVQRAVQCSVSRLMCGGIALVVLMLIVSAGFPGHAGATTIYSYIDEQGNPRFSDSMENVPEKYRAKVKTHEQSTPQVRPPSTLESVRAIVLPPITALKQKVVELFQGFGGTIPAASVKTGAASSTSLNLSGSQSQILTYAGGGAVVLLLVMYLTKSPMMRLLGLGLLIVLGIGTPVLMYVSEDGPADIMKQKAIAAGQAQQDRLKAAGQ